MIFGFLFIVIFLAGFFLGVFERKIDRLKIKNPLTQNKKSGAEVLFTPSDAEFEQQESKDFYNAIK